MNINFEYICFGNIISAIHIDLIIGLDLQKELDRRYYKQIIFLVSSTEYNK